MLVYTAGSSPRVRGTYAGGWEDDPVNRFIPACAGNICGITAAMPTPSVHPRVCGEHAYQASKGDYPPGSSPRVRGTFTMEVDRLSDNRFIPACAGNIDPFDVATWEKAVHPRVCGEHGPPAAIFGYYIGSSPRVRGTYVAERQRIVRGRFIPACAGNI